MNENSVTIFLISYMVFTIELNMILQSYRNIKKKKHSYYQLQCVFQSKKLNKYICFVETCYSYFILPLVMEKTSRLHLRCILAVLQLQGGFVKFIYSLHQWSGAWQLHTSGSVHCQLCQQAQCTLCGIVVFVKQNSRGVQKRRKTEVRGRRGGRW